MKSGKVFLGIVAGVAAGAFLGILFAPKKGSKTRKQIMKKGEAYADQMLAAKNELVSKSKQYADDLQAKYDDLLATVTEKYESLLHKAETAASNGKAKLEEVKKEVKI